jgi:hypothetical protein
VEAWSVPLAEQLERRAGGVTATIDKVTNSTRPGLDLAELARKNDPPGVLAGLIRRIEAGESDDEVKSLLEDARQKLLEVHRAAAYVQVADDAPPDLEAARRALVREGVRLLETLRAQESPG